MKKSRITLELKLNSAFGHINVKSYTARPYLICRRSSKYLAFTYLGKCQQHRGQLQMLLAEAGQERPVLQLGSCQQEWILRSLTHSDFLIRQEKLLYFISSFTRFRQKFGVRYVVKMQRYTIFGIFLNLQEAKYLLAKMAFHIRFGFRRSERSQNL